MASLKEAKLNPRKKTGKRPASWKPPTAGRLVTVLLSTRHRLGPTPYGPGEVRVRETIARELQSREDVIRDVERRFLQPTDVIVSVDYGNHPHIQRVPQGYFDKAMADTWAGHMAPGLTLSGTGG